MTKVSQLLNGGIRYGKDVYAGAASLEPGLLVKLQTGGSTVVTAGSAAANKPFGFLWGNRHRPYTPTTRVFDSGEPVTVIFGVGIVALSADFFDGGALPAALDKLYAAETGGLWTKSITANQVGDCIEIVSRTEATAGVGASQNLAVCRFNIQP